MADQDQGIFPTDYVTGFPTYGSSPDEPPKEEKKKKDPALDLQSDPIAAVNDFFAPAKPTQEGTPKPTSQSVADEVAKDPTTAVNKFFGPTPQEKPTEQAGGEGIVQYIKDEWNKKPHEEPSTTQDAADVLISYAKDATPDELNNKYQKYLKESTPQELEKIQKAIPHWALPDDQWQRLYEYQKSKPLEVTGKDVADIAKGVFSTGVGVVRGATKIGYDIFSTDPASNDALKSDVYSYLEPIMSLPETAGWMGAKALQGGFKATDWLGEKAGVLSPEETQRRAKARYMVDVAKAQTLKDSGDNFYRRMATSPTTQAAVKSLIQLHGPSDESITAAHPDWTPDQIKAYKDSEAEKQATELTQQIAADQPALDEDVKQLGTFFTPGGLGMGDLSVVLGGTNLAKGVAGLAREAFVPAAEIAAQNAAKVASNAEKIAAGVEKAQQPSWWGQLADTTKNLQKQVEAFKEANPTLARIGEAGLEYAPAAVLGYEASGHEGTGALGAIAAVALGKRLGFGKAISELPTVVSDLDKARMLSAGGKIGTFEMAGALPEASKVTQALFSGGRGAFTDRFLQSFGDYATEGVNMTALGAATGVLTSQDKEEFKQTLETGLAYALGGKVLSKVLHSDPAVAARRQRQQDIDNHITFKTLDPNTQQNLTQGSDWSNVIRESYLKVANAEGNLAHAKDLGDKKLIDIAERDLKAANDLHRQNQIASPETQEAYRREVLGMVTRGNELANGSQRAGLRNAGISLLTTQQIYEKLRSRPENAAKSDAQLYAIADNSNGVYFEGNTVSMPAMSPAASHGQYEGVTFDPQKPTVVVNMDKVKNNMGTLGRSFFTTMSHEIGHALFAIPEFREANAKTEEMLFGKTYRDLDGTVYEQTTGAFSPKDLTDMFVNKYLGDKGYTPDDVKAFADSLKLWDRQNDRLDEAKTAAYMKEEILAGLVGLNLTPKIDNPGVRHMLDWGSLQTQNNVARNAINKVFAVGGKAPHGMATDALTGVTFTPQQLSANRQALRELHKLNGIVSTPDSIGVSSPSVSKLDFLANKGLWSRYGKDSGLLKHEMRATVYGPDGTAIGSTVLTDPNAKEGSWSHKDGQVQQNEGYGTLPAGITVPDGGSVRVQKQIVMKADGQTPEMLSAKEAKQLQQTRAQLIRDALINSYEGEVGGFAPTSDDQLSMGGTFTAKQIQAIRDLPESHVPKSLKDNILRINDLVSKKQGLRMFIDYAAMMTDAGKYKAFSPKIYEIVPLSMNFSKDGNFYVTTASVTRMLNKAKLWQERLPGRLKHWNGDTDAFFRDFGNIYLKNWQEGRPGEAGLDTDPNVALEKKNIFADFLNFATKETASLHDRSQLPRKRGDERGKDLDRIFMSVRADHIRDMIESSNDPLPIDVRKGKFNLSPARKEGTEPMGGESKPKDIYDPNQKYHKIIPEITHVDPNVLRVRDAGEVREIPQSDAENMDYSDPIHVSLFSDGSMMISDGHHRVAAAKQTGKRSINAIVQAINANGKIINDAIEKSNELKKSDISSRPFTNERERITDATYTDPRTGEVSRGNSHLEANPNAPQEATDRESPAYGFATDSGRIVDRNEAFNIAQNAGQLMSPSNEEEKFHFDRGVLHSGMFTPAGGDGAAGLRFSPAAKTEKFEPLPSSDPNKWTEVKEAPIITLKDLIGRKVFPTFADLTSGGRIYRGIDSSEIAVPINTHGGPEWPLLQPEEVGQESNVWSNQGAGVSTTKANRANQGAVMLVTAMDKNAHISNTEVGNAIIATNAAYARDGRITKNGLKAINSSIKKEFKDFPGIESPNIDEYVSQLPFQGANSRARLADILSQKDAESQGAANVQRILDEMRSPEYEGSRAGDAVMAIELTPGSPVVKLGEQGTLTHPSYQYAVRGRVLGKFARPMNWRMVYDDFLNQRRQEGKPVEGDRRAIDLAKPLQEITPEIANRISQTPYESLKSPRHAQILQMALNDEWKSSEGKIKEGAVSPADFINTLNGNEAKIALDKYTLPEIKKKLKDGAMTLYKLGDSSVYFAVKKGDPASGYGKNPKDYGFGDNEKTLSLVLNGERGTAGMGDAIMVKALQEGVTALDAFAVKSRRHPNGMLPALYNRFGFETVGEIPFDASYYSKNELEDLKKFWRKSGWEESTGYPPVVLMKWKGNESQRNARLIDIVGQSSPGIRERAKSFIGNAASGGLRTAGGPSESPQREPRRGDSGRGGGSEGATPQGIQLGGGTLGAVQELFGMSDAELQNIGLDPAQVAKVKQLISTP